MWYETMRSLSRHADRFRPWVARPGRHPGEDAARRATGELSISGAAGVCTVIEQR